MWQELRYLPLTGDMQGRREAGKLTEEHTGRLLPVLRCGQKKWPLGGPATACEVAELLGSSQKSGVAKGTRFIVSVPDLDSPELCPEPWPHRGRAQTLL